MCSSGEKGADAPPRGMVLVVSGPSGVGKSTVVKRLLEDRRFVLSISATTRPRRPGEENGREYHFLSRDEFKRWIEGNRFIEYVELFGNYYGTPLKPLQEAVRGGKVYVLDIDVQGAIRLRGVKQVGLYVLLKPPDTAELERRLRGRATEGDEQLQERISHAKWELAQTRYYDTEVVNDNLDKAVQEIKSLVESHLRD
jgi:guanylate kinase